MRRSGSSSPVSIFTGITFIILGSIWILNNMKVLNLNGFEWWPLIFVWTGLLHMVNQKSIFDLSGWLFTILGTVFILTSNNVLEWKIIEKFWPVILILIGFGIIFQRRRYSEKKGDISDKINTIEGIAIFSAFNRKLDSKAFRRGRITAVLGGAEIDFRNAELNKRGAVLELTAVFGGIVVKIPEHWNIELKSSAVFGGVENKSMNSVGVEGDDLSIRAKALFGGVEIKN